MTKKHFDADDKEVSYLTDEQLAELDRRVKSFEEGKSKMSPWEEVKARILETHSKKLKQRKNK